MGINNQLYLGLLSLHNQMKEEAQQKNVANVVNVNLAKEIPNVAKNKSKQSITQKTKKNNNQKFKKQLKHDKKKKIKADRISSSEEKKIYLNKKSLTYFFGIENVMA